MSRSWPATASVLAAMCLSALPPMTAQAQTVAPAVTAAPGLACSNAYDMTPAHLYGLWQLTLHPLEGSATQPVSTGALLFERHPEYPGSVRGSLTRSSAGNPLKALVSGDITSGTFNLDESADGKNMDAVWEGDIPPASCGQEIRGVRRPVTGREGNEPELQFVLKKAPGWR